MNNKELLQKIKNVRTAVKEIYGNVNTITYPMHMVDWLIEQAERVQRCQESYSGLNKMYDHWRNKAKELEKQLKQAQAKAERYEKALEFYADEENYKENLISEAEQIDGIWVEPAHYEPPIIYFDKGQIARQALEGEEK